MRKTLPLILIAVLLATGCAQLSTSRLNPLNWFGPSTQAAANVDAQGNLRPLVTSADIAQVVDARVAIASVDALEIIRTPGGALVRASGTASTQGAYNAQLVPVARGGGTLELVFRVAYPDGFTATGPAAARRVTVARALDRDELAGISRITVRGATNARSASR